MEQHSPNDETLDLPISIDTKSFVDGVADEVTPLRQPVQPKKKVVPSPKIIHNSTLKTISPIKKSTTPIEQLRGDQNRVKIERQPSRDKNLEINHSSGSIVDTKKQKIFNKVFDLLLIDAQHSKIPLIHPNTANLRHIPFQVIELMIDVFTEFEMENQVWNKEKFLHKCNEAYNKMPQGDRSLLLKFFEKPDPQKRRNSSAGSQTAKKQIKPEINANSAQMCLSVRQYGVNTNELLYNQAQNIQRKKEQLREKYDQTSQCTFKPAINKDFKKVNGSQMPQSVMERSFRQTASEAQFKPVRAAVNVISPYKKQ